MYLISAKENDSFKKYKFLVKARICMSSRNVITKIATDNNDPHKRVA